ncbi:MAG: HD-GYP domain-containing protein [Acidimicrobiia bacterium]
MSVLATDRNRRPWLISWAFVWLALISVETTAALLPGTTPWWTSPIALFVLVVVAASLCAIAAVVVLVVACRQDLAELGLIGAFAFAVSVLPLVHGITTPGVVYGPNAATMSSVFWALPLASLAAAPLTAPNARWSRSIMRRWRLLVFTHVAAAIAVATLLLVRPSALPFPAMGTATAVLAAVMSLSVCLALSVRQLRFAWIARSRQPFLVSIGFAFVGVSSLVWVGRAPWTIGFWLAHALDVIGVFLLTIGAVVAFRQRPSLREIVRPLTVHTPLSAFELGLEPLVHQFVAALDAKDSITRDHVVRSAELAIRVGTSLGMSASDLHTLGLGALLHDIGKLTVPTEIINKPGKLDDNEYALMRSHAVAGERLVLGSRVLAPIAPIVRGHHERVDGRGYPDGLPSHELPLAVRVVSVCDAFDAMANTRQYREGMGIERAVAILREHAGAQWDSAVVEALVTAIEEHPPSYATLSRVGRNADAVPVLDWCGCGDALPDEVLAEVS